MQNAKDSFYEVLRGRLAILNPERTIVVRGVTRPAAVVDENETESTAGLPDCFHLSWTGMAANNEGANPLVSLTCQVRYGTSGTAMNSGLDRGRAMAAMDAELLRAVQQWPQNAPKNNYAGLASGLAAVPTGTCVWWSDVSFGPAEIVADRLTRVAVMQVLSFQEVGEL